MNLQQPIFDALALGKKAERERLNQGLSIEDLAGKAGVNKNTVVRFEKGRRTHPETIYKICGALGVSPLELILLCHLRRWFEVSCQLWQRCIRCDDFLHGYTYRLQEVYHEIN